VSPNPVPETEYVVKIDASDLQKALREFADELKTVLAPKTETKTEVVTATAPSTSAREAFIDWLVKSVRAEGKATEAVAGVPSTFTYSRDLVIVRDQGITAGLRQFAQVVKLSRGENRAQFYKINVPSFAALTPGVAPTEASQTITTVEATVSERGAMQVVRYDQIEQSVVDVVNGVEETLQIAAEIDLDRLILSELDTNTNKHIAGGKSAENNLAASDTLKLSELIAAKRRLIELSKRFPRPGELVLVCHPKQYFDLLSDAGILKALEFGSAEPVQKGILPQVLGINIIPTDLVTSGTTTGSPSVTYYRAHLFFPKAFGLAVSRDLTIEAFREPPKRTISLTATYVAGAKLIEPKYALQVVTA
jgi:N4-gp56 family major capsid protein